MDYLHIHKPLSFLSAPRDAAVIIFWLRGMESKAAPCPILKYKLILNFTFFFDTGSHEAQARPKLKLPV